MKPLLLVLLFCAASTACRRSASAPPPAASANTLTSGTFIRSPGTYSYEDGSVTHTLEVNPVTSNQLSWRLSTRNQSRHGGWSSSSGSSSFHLPSPSSPWFIYAEAPTMFWIFDGDDTLSYHQRDDHRGNTSGTAISNGELQQDAPGVPAEIVPSLSESMRKLFPQADPASRPPSL